MTKNDFETPDMEDIARQMQEAMDQAQKAMDELPGQLAGLEDVMGSLSGLMGDMPSQLGELSGAIEGFSGQHQANVDSMAGEPDWGLEAHIQVGSKLELVVNAVFDLENIKQAWQSTQGGGFESLVAGVVADSGEDYDAGTMGQIMDQLKQGRSIALVKGVDVLECRIQGAPGGAADLLQFSPEANIPLAMREDGLSLEFAPLLTIRNQWENAIIPTFSPMGDETVVPLSRFESGDHFSISFEPIGQEELISIELNFHPLT
jgi:hypothetical protein